MFTTPNDVPGFRERLSLCIPTRNRSYYLNEILEMFTRQVEENHISELDFVVYISDNASTDNTLDLVKKFAERLPRVVYSRNETNIGPDGNNILIRTLARGEYVWAVGDDEIIHDNALPNILAALKKHQPGLLLAFDTEYPLHLKPQLFADYRSFAEECLRYNPHAMAEHSLISSNVYRADCFDIDYARQNIPTNYPHMHGLIRPLQKRKGSVVLPDFPVIKVRKEHPSPITVEMPWIDVDAQWIAYFTWLRDELQLPDLNPLFPSHHASRIMRQRILRNPVKYVWENRKVILNKNAYKFFFKRFFGTHRATST